LPYLHSTAPGITVSGFDVTPQQALTLMTLFALMPSFTLMTITLFKLMAIICINVSTLMYIIYNDVLAKAIAM
jgi:hypothetical protein